MSKVECFACHEYGHIARDCPSKQQTDTAEVAEDSQSETNSGEKLVHEINDEEFIHTIGVRRHSEGMSLFLPIKLCEISTKFLVDTGASVTVLSRSVYERIEEKSRPQLTPTPVHTRLEVADNSYVPVDGIAKITLVAGGLHFEWSVLVSPISDFGHNYLLGAGGFLELDGKTMPTEVEGMINRVHKITLSCDTVIPSYSELIV